ncbi:bacterial regulatory protein, tetR family protein [Asticcacaulis biprosthecium C19]|uniref:Bacterial regulatory protein, tetR family protein n=1 Tax=Asticcacaulis biprosthecium C19 TaxID=715226 RepID=F4QQ12_9CAUL|nr:TetR/AcrR family transcriptional regulator [Asticcacaulis biprosthecium]EGF90299.1 bacterial regulatory protein, tetR family protein [Asticcacaulis biprosthecium C19]
MKTSRATVERNRERLLQTASAQVRKRGIEGLKVADLMRECGLTHGGFGTYFDSKEDLVAQACAATLQRQSERIGRAVATGSFQAELLGLFERYLSQQNRDHPEGACLFPSLAGDMPRQPQSVRAIFTTGLKDYLAGMQALLGGDEAEAMTVMSTLVGAMVLSRAVDDVAYSDRLLEAVQERLTEVHAADGSPS